MNEVECLGSRLVFEVTQLRRYDLLPTDSLGESTSWTIEGAHRQYCGTTLARLECAMSFTGETLDNLPSKLCGDTHNFWRRFFGWRMAKIPAESRIAFYFSFVSRSSLGISRKAKTHCGRTRKAIRPAEANVRGAKTDL